MEVALIVVWLILPEWLRPVANGWEKNTHFLITTFQLVNNIHVNINKLSLQNNFLWSLVLNNVKVPENQTNMDTQRN